MITVTLPVGCNIRHETRREVLILPTDTAARALRAALSASLVRNMGGGRKSTCTCGSCRKCKVRSNVQAYRDRKASERKIEPIEDQITQEDFYA